MRNYRRGGQEREHDSNTKVDPYDHLRLGRLKKVRRDDGNRYCRDKERDGKPNNTDKPTISRRTQISSLIF